MPCLPCLFLVLLLVGNSCTQTPEVNHDETNKTTLPLSGPGVEGIVPPANTAPPVPASEDVLHPQIALKMEGSPIMSNTTLDLANATKKLPKGVGDACEEKLQCESVVPNSECRDSKCACPLNYVYTQSRCWQKQMFGGQCNITEQCEDITHAVCAQGVCTCESPLVPSSMNKCLAPAGSQYSAQCEEDIQCTFSYGDEAHCSDDHCVCTSYHHYNGTKCITDKKLGDACLVDGDCAVSDVNNMQDSRMCLRNACVCSTGFNALPGENTCTKSSGEELAVSLTWVLCIALAKYYLV